MTLTTDLGPEGEAALLLEINAGLPEATWRRHRALDKKRRAGILTPVEHQELIQINDVFEEYGARRVSSIAELAKLRRVPFDEMWRQLSVHA